MASTTLLRKIIQDIQASYWFIPAIVVLASIGLAQMTSFLDENLDALPFDLPEALLETQVDGARSVLTTIAQSMIGVTGVMYSMTLVAVSFASGNFGPRLIGNFMRDRGTQVSLSIMISTFVYALLILRTVQSSTAPNDPDIAPFVPHLSVMIALALAMISVGVMIYFIHHVPETISLSNITADLGRKLHQEVKKISHQAPESDPRAQPGAPDWLSRADMADATEVCLDEPGYVQTLNTRQMSILAEKHDWNIEVLGVPGTFVDPLSPVARLWCAHDARDGELDKLRGCFAIGLGRTENQNLLFLAEQLVEVIARALSPGVNDPYSAVTCLNWLHVSLKAALFSNEGSGAFRDTQLRVQVPPVTFHALLQVAHVESRAYVSSDPNVALHAIGLLDTLADLAPLGPRRDAVLEERRLLRKELEARDPHSQRL